MEVVNSIKLTKLEKKVLKALLIPRKEKYSHYPEEGNDILGLAKLVYGNDILNRERLGGHYCANISLTYAAKSSLSRLLKQLFLKGLVKKCKPIYRYGWIPRNGQEDWGGYYTKTTKVLRLLSISENGKWRVEEVLLRDLPLYCHVWWMLTEVGKNLMNELD